MCRSPAWYPRTYFPGVVVRRPAATSIAEIAGETTPRRLRRIFSPAGIFRSHPHRNGGATTRGDPTPRRSAAYAASHLCLATGQKHDPHVRYLDRRSARPSRKRENASRTEVREASWTARSSPRSRGDCNVSESNAVLSADGSSCRTCSSRGSRRRARRHR